MPELSPPPLQTPMTTPGNGRALHVWIKWFDAVHEQLKALIAAAATLLTNFLVQHNANGTHKTVTVADGTLAAPSYGFTSNPGTGLRLLAANILQFVTAGVARFAITTTSVVSALPLVPDVTGTLDLGTTLLRWRDALLSGAIFERGRTLAMGDWLDVAFNAANFTASAGAWTVIAANQVTYAYTIEGRKMTVMFWLDATNVTVGGLLFLAIPGGFTAARTVLAPIRANDAGAGFVSGLAFVSPGGVVIDLRSNMPAAGWAATGASNTSVQGEITFPVQ